MTLTFQLADDGGAETLAVFEFTQGFLDKIDSNPNVAMGMAKAA